MSKIRPQEPETHVSSGLVEAFDWISAIKSWRERRALSQPQLAERSGVSLGSIKSYETGVRRPSKEALESLISALGIPVDEANQILGGAGYAVDWRGLFEERYAPPTIDEMSEQANGVPWPVLVTNQAFDLVTANIAAQRLFEVDLTREYTGYGERNVLSRLTDDEFATRMENWDEVVTFMCALAKADPRWRSEDPGRPAPWLEEAVKRLLDGSPTRIKRLIELWESAEPIPHGILRPYRVRWRHEGRLMSFSCRMVMADIWGEMHWNEWIPEDEATWRAVSALAGS